MKRKQRSYLNNQIYTYVREKKYFFLIGTLYVYIRLFFYLSMSIPYKNNFIVLF